MRFAGIRTRSAGPDDGDFIFATRRSTFRAYVERISGWDDTQQRAATNEELGRLPFEIVEEWGDPIGYLCVLHQEDLDFLEELALVPQAQGRGIGTHLLRRILEKAHRRRVPVRLSVFADNPARNLYARLGFGVVGGEHPRVTMEWHAGELSGS
ncbi:GNAT family N-acetyltransferase [Actinopolymorpha sp. B9G3]|uniref:GNAT family N-acetyltransferase n=1 Tax=Actinopolymorpha sp. B9G3 TaxID=3158970 RepID=UPI0032D979FA